MAGISYRNRNKNLRTADGRPRKPNWEYRFYGASIRGKKQVIQKSGFATKQEAIAAGNKAYTEYMQAGSVFTPSEMSYSDCLDAWLTDYVAIKCKETTRTGYAKSVELYIRPALGKYRLAAIKPENIQQFINDMYYKSFSRNTLTNLLGIISNSMRFAKRRRWIQYSPAEDIDLPGTRECRNQRHVVRDAIFRQDLEKVFTRFPEGHSCHLPMMLAYHCGLRLGEVFGLTWDDIDLQNGILTVNRQIQWVHDLSRWRFTSPKYESTRMIPLDNVIWVLLKREHARQSRDRLRIGRNYLHYFTDKDDLLCQGEGGKEVRLVHVRWDGSYIQSRATQHSNHVIKTELGVTHFDFHSLRHTHATMLAEAGAPIKYTQFRLGHKNVEVTLKIYQKLSQGLAEQGAVALEQIFRTGE